MVRLVKNTVRISIGLIVIALSSITGVQAELSVLSQNMSRFFDDIDDGNLANIESQKAYRHRVRLAADKLLGEYQAADIIALQEIENIGILRDLAEAIDRKGGPHYAPVLLEGNDVSGIDVGYLIQTRLHLVNQKQLFQGSRFGADDSPLFSRPPLLVEVCAEKCITLLNLHLRSMRGLRSKKKSHRVATKRHQQAAQIARWINQFQTQHPDKSLIVLGDFNALKPADRYTDIVGTLIGKPDNSKKRYPSKDWISKDMINLTLKILKTQRFSFVYKGQQQTLDYMLVNREFEKQLKKIAYGRIDRNYSDHAGLRASFNW